MPVICATRETPSKELSSTLPTKGETYAAPALAARIACAAEKINVTLTFIDSLAKILQAANPPRVQGTLIASYHQTQVQWHVQSYHIQFQSRRVFSSD